MNKHKESTKSNYLGIWRNFNKFIIQLDYIPDTWEEKLCLYCTYLTVDTKLQSSTLKSYISAIKAKLETIGHTWDQNLFWFALLTRACKLKNDRVYTRLPIRNGLLECIVFETQQRFAGNSIVDRYLKSLFSTAFLIAYNGLMRIGEYTQSQHVMKAKDVHIAENKDKVLIILHTSKTHGIMDRPQKIIIEPENIEQTSALPPHSRHRFNRNSQIFCPVTETIKYSNLRPPLKDEDEQFFIYQDGTPLMQQDVRNMLKASLCKLGLNKELYETHSFRIGKASDLLKHGFSIEKIKEKGRWKSNAVYKYLRQ